MQQAAGVTGPTPKPVDPAHEPAEPTADAEPKPDGKVVKAVDGVLDFFSKWN